MPLDKLLKTDYQRAPILWFHQKHKEGEGVGSYFPYILLTEIPLKEMQTMFLQLAKLSGLNDRPSNFPLFASKTTIKTTLIIRWPPRKVTALQVVRTSFLGPRPHLATEPIKIQNVSQEE